MRNIYHLFLYLVSMLLASKLVSAANVDLQIKGLSLTLEKNVRSRISMIQNEKIILNQQYQEYMEKAIRKGLKALGYYESKIHFKLDQSAITGHQILTISVMLGDPVRIGGINIILRGDAQTDDEYRDLLNKLPKIGSILNHGDYDNFKKSLVNISLRKGYFDSHFNKSKLNITINHHQAFWDIDYDSGERYRFGAVTFEGSQIHNEYLQNLVPFKRGSYYQSRDVGELNRRLSAIGWFNSAVVAPEFDKVYKTKLLPLRATLYPHVGNIIEIGIGYSTDIGSHAKAVWKKPWVNYYGHNLITNFSLSASEQQLELNYKIPLLRNPLEQYYLLQGNFKRLDINNLNPYSTTTFILSRHWDFSDDWQWIVDLHWSFNRFSQYNNIDTAMLLYPGIIISRTRAHGGLMPTWGDNQRYSIDCSDTIWGSYINFLIIQAQNIWIRTFYERHRFLIRGNFGWILTRDFIKIPLEQRFFIGGDRSIRGYKYKSIGIKNYNGESIGAPKMIISSLEYQYNLVDKWWGLIFIDSGEAISDIRCSNFKHGIGIGIRWQSFIGLIKLDLAIPINDKEKHSLQFYIGLGPEL